MILGCSVYATETVLTHWDVYSNCPLVCGIGHWLQILGLVELYEGA